LISGYITGKGPSIKDLRTRGEGGPVRRFCRKGSFFRCGRLHFLSQKIKIYGVSARKRGRCASTDKGEGRWASADILRTSGRRSIFHDFVSTSFMDGL